MRVSVSDLDQYKYYLDSDLSLEDLLRRLRRQEPPSYAMLAGSALHTILEHSCGELTECEQDGVTFRFEIDRELTIPEFREVKMEKEYTVNGKTVTLVGIVDAMDAGTIYDHKLTSRFDAERYMAAYQWRAYLDMFNCNKFVYNIFVGQDKGDYHLIHTFEQMPLYRYDGMRDKLIGMVGEFMEFAKIHLPEKYNAQ